jgi:formate dehydrogenase iron-sulfur subunit
MAMDQGFSILVDTSRCTGCRGCQIACKQWNQLPGTQTRNMGTYQNPQDLSAKTWKLVRFNDGKNGDGKPYWHFFSDQCRHCLSPGCMAEVEKGEIVQDEKTGAVLFTPKTKNLNFKATLEGCPYNIPRQDPKSKQLFKCTMCFDRISNNQIPACVKTCPTGTMVFGKRDKILAMAKQRVDTLKKNFPKAAALNADDVRVIYIVKDDPKKYSEYAAGK